jgi:hypothetical protein
MIQTELPTLTDLLNETQQLTNTHSLPELEPLDPSPVPAFVELLAQYNASVDELTDPFSIYQTNLALVRPRPVRWLWQERLPLSGITLLDGDHDCGKSLLALQIAAHVSSGTPMPDGTPTIQGGVVIVTPDTDATTAQLQLLTALGADLSHIEFLSFVQVQSPESHTSNHRPFSLPEDLPRLFDATKRVDARLVILDPFINLLSREHRCTNQHLYHLLSDLNQRLIEHNVACLLVRNCHARGGRARPSALERSDHFITIAVSRLLLAPDPIQPARLLLSHAKSRHTALTSTLILQIQSLLANPAHPHITVEGVHTLQANDLISHRPDALHRRLLTQDLLHIITETPDPVPVATLYSLSPHSGVFQIQRALSSLFRMGLIDRPARGFYTLTNPTFPLDTTATTTQTTTPKLNATATTTQNPTPKLNTTATITQTPTPKLNTTATITQTPTPKLNATATTDSDPTPKLNTTATITQTPTTNKTSKRSQKGQKKHKNTKKRR